MLQIKGLLRNLGRENIPNLMRVEKINIMVFYQLGKARRLKQAKEEAQAEIEAYRQERERQYREHEAKVAKNYV